MKIPFDVDAVRRFGEALRAKPSYRDDAARIQGHIEALRAGLYEQPFHGHASVVFHTHPMAHRVSGMPASPTQ
ncbi:MAG TPA: hypothetical protein DF383_09670, partial [Deltaproteobacteria bacterium]|nr:hypothetical protein [Deltaproteobacteria bacterium]